MSVLETILEKRFFAPWWEGDTGRPGSLWRDANLELFVTAACNQNCEYCYLVRHQELYPRDIRNPETIKQNLRVFLETRCGGDVKMLANHLFLTDIFSQGGEGYVNFGLTRADSFQGCTASDMLTVRLGVWDELRKVSVANARYEAVRETLDAGGEGMNKLTMELFQMLVSAGPDQDWHELAYPWLTALLRLPWLSDTEKKNAGALLVFLEELPDSGAVPLTISKSRLFVQIAEYELDHIHRKGLFILSPAVHELAP